MARPQTLPLTDKDTVDVAGLAAFLRARGVALADAVTVTRFPGGHSNLTYLVDDGALQVIVRAPPPGAHTVSGHDMVREARVLQAVGGRGVKVPRVLAVGEDAASSPLGAPFFAMERVAGRVLRHKLPDDVVLDATRMQTLTTALVDELAALHALDLDDGTPEARALMALGKPEGYVQRQVDGWIARYEKAKTDDISDIDAVVAWLRAGVSAFPSSRPSIVHNDFKLDNVVVSDDATAICAVLDWELATVGEPLLDLGTTLAYWVQADDGDDVKALPMGLTWLPGCLRRAEVVARWAERTGRAVENDALVFAFVLASFKVAVIAQQIYARYQRGFSTDPRFAMLDFAVAVIGARARRAIDDATVG